MPAPFEANLNVLLVEDDPNDALLVQMGFERLHRPSTLRVVNDGEEAVKYLCAQPPYHDRLQYPFPDIILTDLKMPPMDGFEFLAWMREHPECSVVPTIVMSSSDRPEDVRRAYQLGANCYFVKPHVLKDLVRLITLTFEFWQHCERIESHNSRCREQTVEN